MRSPNNIVFTAIQALFDDTLFPKCLNMRQPGFTPVGITPDDLQCEHNIPPDDENEDYGGGDFPPIPPANHGRAPYVPPRSPPCLLGITPPSSPNGPMYMPQTPVWPRSPNPDAPLPWSIIRNGRVIHMYPLHGITHPDPGTGVRHPAGWILVPAKTPNLHGHTWMSPDGTSLQQGGPLTGRTWAMGTPAMGTIQSSCTTTSQAYSGTW